MLDFDKIYHSITNNQSNKVDINGNEYIEFSPVKYRWTHGATDYSIGDGLIIYSLIHHIRAKVCVCLGSGGGFIPRIMTEARLDLHRCGIFEGRDFMEWGDIGTTILVDANNGIGGDVDYTDKDSFFRKMYPCRIIFDTTESAYYNFFVREDIKIDYLHIDASHSYNGVKLDFELYSKLLNPHGIISIHDTDSSYEKDYIVTNDILDQNHHHSFNGPSKFIKELTNTTNEWEIFNLFNNGIKRDKPSTTGLTILQRRK